jgi:hypothetical protein
VLTLKHDDDFCRFWVVRQQTSPLRIAPAGEIYYCPGPGILVLLHDIQSVAIEEERVIAEQFVQFHNQRMVVRDHLGLELRQSLFDLLGIKFHDALHWVACRPPHLLNLNGSPAPAYRRVVGKIAHAPFGLVAIFTVATTVLVVTDLPTGIFAARKFTTVFATKFWTVLGTTILTTWGTIALMVWASGGAQR